MERRINQVSGSFQAMSLEPRMTRGRGKGLRKSFEQEEDKELFKEYVVRLNVAWWHKNEETAKLHHLEFLQNALRRGGIRRDVETASHTYCSFNCFVSEAEIRILEGKQEVTDVTPVDKYRSCLHDFAMSDEVMRCMEGYILTPENSTPVPGLSVPLWSK